MYNINIPGIPDLSNLDLSNLNSNLSRFNLQGPAPTPVPAPVPAPVPEPGLAPVPVFDPVQFNPYAGMTQADMVEIGMVAPMPAPGTNGAGVPPIDLFDTMPAPVTAPVPAPTTAPVGIETMAPNFPMTEDFALPVEQQQLMPATTPVTPTPEPEQLTPSQYYEQRYGVSGVPDDYSFNGAELPDETAKAILQAVANGQIAYGPDLNIVKQPAGTTPYTMDSELGDTFVFDPSVYIEPTPTPQSTPQPTEPMGPPAGIVAGQYSTPSVNNQMGEDYTEGMVTDVPDVASVAQGLINPGVVTLPNGETLDLSNINLGNIDLTNLGVSPGVASQASQEAQGTTPAQTARGGEDLSQIPGGYFTAASDYYTDGQLADMGIEPGTVVSTGANPTQPAGTPLDLTPEQQAAIDNWVASNPPGTIINTPIGNISLPDLSQYTNTGSSRNIDAARYVVQNLTMQQGPAQQGGSVATEYQLKGSTPTQPAGQGNPFQRPSDQGIASLVPPGG